MDERLSKSVGERRFQMLLLGVFAAMALVIATVGIRMALGAQASDVMKMVIWHGLSQSLIGVALGLAAAFALTRAQPIQRHLHSLRYFSSESH